MPADGPIVVAWTIALGQTVRFPLDRNLAVKTGQYVGAAVPTWAPALQVGLGSDTAWRASRAEAQCTELNITSIQTVLLGARGAAPLECLYRATRLTFSATCIPSAPAPGAGRALNAGDAVAQPRARISIRPAWTRVS